MSKETEEKINEYQEALDLICNPTKKMFGRNKEGKEVCVYEHMKVEFDKLQELVNIYPEYLKLKEKSTPKKPKLNHYDNDCTKIICPNDCGIQLNGLNRDNEIASFTHEHCPKCGQAIDWSKDA